jgi:hypothetical protein
MPGFGHRSCGERGNKHCSSVHIARRVGPSQMEKSGHLSMSAFTAPGALGLVIAEGLSAAAPIFVLNDSNDD